MGQSVTVRANRGDVCLRVGVATNLVDISADQDFVADQIGVALDHGTRPGGLLITRGANLHTAVGIGADAQTTGVDLGVRIAICVATRVYREQVACSQVAINKCPDVIVQIDVAGRIRTCTETVASRNRPARDSTVAVSADKNVMCRVQLGITVDGQDALMRTRGVRGSRTNGNPAASSTVRCRADREYTVRLHVNVISRVQLGAGDVEFRGHRLGSRGI